MDITNIDFSKVDPNLGIKLGQDQAPLQMIIYLNLACPFCRKFHQANQGLLEDYVSRGLLQVSIKLYDRDKKDLRNSNIIHQYLPYDDPELAYQWINYFLAHQEVFKHADQTEVVQWLEEELALSKQDNQDFAQSIRDEGEAAGVQFIPTAYFKGQIFDEHEDYFTIREWLDNALSRVKGKDRDLPAVDTSKITDKQALILGDDQAPVTVYEYLNFRCPDAKAYFQAVQAEMAHLVANGQVRRVIKHLPMTKKGLFKGNVMNRFVDYKNPDQAYQQIVSIYDRLGEWAASDWAGVFDFAEETLGFKYQGNKINETVVGEEAQAANITVTPTIIVGDQVFYDDLDPDEVLATIKNQ